jgi:hypothetical protein
VLRAHAFISAACAFRTSSRSTSQTL